MSFRRLYLEKVERVPLERVERVPTVPAKETADFEKTRPCKWCPFGFARLSPLQILISANIEAGFFHLALAFTLLTTIAFLEEDQGGRDISLLIGFGGYALLSLLGIYFYWKRTFRVYLGLFCLLATLIGLGLLAVYVQKIKGVFPISLSTSYNHPDPIPAPYNSNVINFSFFERNFNVAPPCKREPYKKDEYQEWFQCLRKSEWKEIYATSGDFHTNKDGRLIPKGNWKPFDPLGTLYLWQGVLAFCLITSLFHFLLAYGGARGDEGGKCRRCTIPYWYFIRQGIQPYRWAEYSMTASIMIVLVMSLNRVTDVYLISFVFIIMQLINSFGAAIDYTSSPFLVCWYWLCSGSAFAWVVALLAYSYSESIQPYITPTKEHTADELWGSLFAFITPVNIGIIFSFSSFALVNLVHQCKRFQGCFRLKEGKETGIFPIEESPDKMKYMWWAEITYILLSFISKGLLVITVSFGAATRA